MKKIFITIILAIGAVCANAQFLFRISGNQLKEPSHILGTIHTLPGSLLDSIPEYLEAEAKCRQLYAEYDVSNQQAMNQALTAGQQAATLPDGKTIYSFKKNKLNFTSSKLLDFKYINISLKKDSNVKYFLFF